MNNKKNTCRLQFSSGILYKKGVGVCLFALAIPLSAQVPGSALDHMLQRPKVAKHFENKTFGDHLFVEGGIGANSIVTRSSSHFSTAGLTAQLGIGDWVTPLHGWRLGFQGGKFSGEQNSANIMGASLDYLLNITALSVSTMRDSTYSNSRMFELIGKAGVDYVYTTNNGVHTNALGAHLGLRGQVNLSRFGYFYLEPMVGLYSDKITQESNWRGYRFAASVAAGLGYRLQEHTANGVFEDDGHFLNHTFVSLTGGPSSLLQSSGSQTKYAGARVGGYIGKWFSPYSGVRLGALASTYKQEGHQHVKALNASVGYLWNMHNTFGGYDPNRTFWVNAVADASINASASGDGRKLSPGFGAGLQANFHLAHGVDFFIEPRVDAYKKGYAAYGPVMKKLNAAGSIMAGLSFMQGGDTRTQLARNDDFKQETAYDHLFLEAGIGGALPGTSSAAGHPFTYVRPAAFMGVGKWFNATSGVRLWGQAAQIEGREDDRVKTVSVGADYLWNINNAFHGYDPDRRFELIGSLGANLAMHGGEDKVYPGLQAGLKGLWHINRMWGLFIEPQAQIHAKDYLEQFTTPGLRRDVTGTLMAGLQVYLHGYQPTENRERFNETELKSFFSMAGGTYTNGNGLRSKENYGLAGRLSYGHWYSPVSAWRLSLTGQANPHADKHFAALLAGGDYIADLTTLTYGYNEDRIVSVRALAGMNFGIDYLRGKTHFDCDIHGGGQLAVRTGRQVELFAEPQVAYRLDKRYDSRMKRIVPQLLLGLNYRLKPVSDKMSVEGTDKKQFASASFGTGLYSGTVTNMSPVRRKFSLDFDLSYGQWKTAAHGWQVGLSDATIQKHGKGNMHITTLHADYLRNLLSASSTSPFRLTGIAGVTANIASREGYRPAYAFGLELGVQAGVAVNDQIEIFAEPVGTLMQKTIQRHNDHPAEAQARFMLGTKINF